MIHVSRSHGSKQTYCEKTLNALEDPSNKAALNLPGGAFSLESSSLWKRRNETKGSRPDQAAHRKIGIMLHVQEQQRHTQKPNTTSTELIIKSIAGQKLRNNSRILLGKSISLPQDGYHGVPEETAFTVPQSAPPAIASVFVSIWPSPQLPPPPSVEFYEWTHGTTRGSPSSCYGTAKHANSSAKTPTSKNDSTSGSKELEFPVDVATKEDFTMGEHVRKPPFHLPPLDPSVFGKKSKNSKKKLRKSQSFTSVSNTDPSPKKVENNDERITKTENNFAYEAGGQYECKEKIGFSDQKLPFANKPVQNMAPYSPVDQSDCTKTEHGHGVDNRDGGSGTQKQKVTKAQVIDHREYKPTVPRHSSSFHHLVPGGVRTMTAMHYFDKFPTWRKFVVIHRFSLRPEVA